MNASCSRTLRLTLTMLLPGAASVAAQVAPTIDSDDYFLDRPDSTKYALIMTGPSVDEDNRATFRQWSFSLYDILMRDYGYSSATITLLHDRGATDFPGGNRIDGATDRAGIERSLDDLYARVETGDQISLYLIGHGSGAGEEAKFNIAGPDITGLEFAAMLDRFDRQDMIIVNTTSASYGFSAALSAEGRVVISSTRSPSEKYDPVFSRYFIEALDSRKGDRDKNRRVSMLEAFEYARVNVEAWYEQQGRLASEHAGLDDNGDALFTLDPANDDGDGGLAEFAYMDTLVDDDSALSPAARALAAKMGELERAVFILRGRKADFLEEDYWRQMEQLLVELARTTVRFNDTGNGLDSSDAN